MPIARVQEMLASSAGRDVNRAVAPLVQGNRYRATRHHLECLWQVLQDDIPENIECHAAQAQCHVCAFLRCHSTVREDALAIATDKNRRLAILLDFRWWQGSSPARVRPRELPKREEEETPSPPQKKAHQNRQNQKSMLWTTDYCHNP